MGDAACFDRRGSTPLSVRMPLARENHGPNEVIPPLSNLLPDAVEARDRWAAKFSETRNDPFTVLRHLGKDAPG
ncbi:HipA N-terminal domain-containing protein [Leucobacter aridicollis]|uniref:HipA N-terminal domain-containing protein n=1 Tax=Leucobacter aridicollis TaxID=283878 RepID=UPI0022093E57|nr:HipA N-terminal domain-containing protein [Leucobacter aridicollis]